MLFWNVHELFGKLLILHSLFYDGKCYCMAPPMFLVCLKSLCVCVCMYIYIYIYIYIHTHLEKEMAIHFSILAWKIPLIEEPGRLTVHGIPRVWHNLATKPLCICIYIYIQTHTHAHTHCFELQNSLNFVFGFILKK